MALRRRIGVSAWVLLVTIATGATEKQEEQIDNCIIGAGPGGLQLASLMEKAGLDYAVFESSGSAGSFYRKYPRHGQLISINRVYADRGFDPIIDSDYNMRFDWNSLLSEDRSLRMRNFTKEFFPPASTMVAYLEAFASAHVHKIRFNTKVDSVVRRGAGFELRGQGGALAGCTRVIIATGKHVPNIPTFLGSEHTIGYEDVPVDPDFFIEKRVGVLGCGNSAMETVDNMVHTAGQIVIYCRNDIRWAHETHYVGDLRAVNSIGAENYQLKAGTTLDRTEFFGIQIFKLPSGKLWLFNSEVGMTELPESMRFMAQDMGTNVTHDAVKQALARLGERTEGGDVDDWIHRFIVDVMATVPNAPMWVYLNSDVTPGRKTFDTIVRALGFKMDKTLFGDDLTPTLFRGLPNTTPFFEHATVPGMYFAGGLMHARDFRRSSGGFIHGFRYLVRSLFHHIQAKAYRLSWPGSVLPTRVSLVNDMVRRLGNSSALYQMFGVLGDVAILSCTEPTKTIEEVPLDGIGEVMSLISRASTALGPLITTSLEFHPDAMGPNPYSWNFTHRATHPFHAKLLLHPVFRFYRNPPVIRDPRHDWDTADLELHLPEDLHNHYDSSVYSKFLARWLVEVVAPIVRKDHPCARNSPLFYTPREEEPDAALYEESRREAVEAQRARRAFRDSIAARDIAADKVQWAVQQVQERRDKARAEAGLSPPMQGSVNTGTVADAQSTRTTDPQTMEHSNQGKSCRLFGFNGQCLKS